jgi:hypothetical protein
MRTTYKNDKVYRGGADGAGFSALTVENFDPQSFFLLQTPAMCDRFFGHAANSLLPHYPPSFEEAITDNRKSRSDAGVMVPHSQLMQQ